MYNEYKTQPFSYQLEDLLETREAFNYALFYEQAIWAELRAELLPNNENLPEDYAQNRGSYVNGEGETIGLLVRRAFFERRT